MADIKLSDIFGGVGGMSDQVIKNKEDIITIKSDVNTRVKKTGDTMTGPLVIDRTGGGGIGLHVKYDNYPGIILESRNLSVQRSKYIEVDAAGALSFITRNIAGENNGIVTLASGRNGEIYHTGYKQQELPVRDVRGAVRPPNYFGSHSISSWFSETDVPNGGWHSGINVRGWGDSYNSWQLVANSDVNRIDNRLYFRTGAGETWNPYYEVYHSGRKPTPGDLGTYTKTEIDNTFTKKNGDTCTGIIKFGANTTEPIELIAPASTPNDTRVRGRTNAGAPSWYVGTEGNNLLVYSNIHGHGMIIGSGYAQFTKELQAKSRLIAFSATKDPDYHEGSIEINGSTADGTACLGFHIPGTSAHSIQMRPDYLGLKVMSQGKGWGNIAANTFEAKGTTSGTGITFNGKTVIGGTNDTWLRINPHSQFSNGIYCGSAGVLRHDGNIQRGSWGSNAAAVIRPATDGVWSVNGDAAFSYTQTNTNGAHWLLASYKDSSNIRSGIQVLSNDGGNLRFYTNGRNNFAEIADGNFLAQNNVTAFSDIRVKKNIKQIENALDKTLKMTGVTYDRTDQDNVRQVGLIAQEVEKVLPEAVITTKQGDIDDFKSVAYGNLVGLLVESIRELNNKIERLEAQLKE